MSSVPAVAPWARSSFPERVAPPPPWPLARCDYQPARARRASSPLARRDRLAWRAGYRKRVSSPWLLTTRPAALPSSPGRTDVARSGAPPDRQLDERECDRGGLVVPNAIAWNVELEDDPEWSVEFAHVAADIFIQVARRGCSGQKRVAGRDSHVHPIDAKGSPVRTAAVLGHHIPAVV